ncbi:MAG: PilW family protein [Proteobacteria bacterium]|nr:PilW family protein [Pseudomonadota bacterium]
MTKVTRMQFQTGLSLVELMISLAIASMITVGLVQMFSASQEGSRMLMGQATIAESGRFAMELIARSVRKAGYRGCNSKRSLDDNINDEPYEFNLTAGLQGFNATGSGWSPNIASILPQTDTGGDSNVYLVASRGINTNDYSSCTTAGCLKEGSDILAVRYASSTEYLVNTTDHPIQSGAEDVVVYNCPLNEAPCGTDPSLADVKQDFDQYHLVFINDCNTEDMFVVTDLSAGVAATAWVVDGESFDNQTVISHSVGGFGSTQNLQGSLGDGSGYQVGATVTPIVSETYYIGASSSRNNQGDPVDSLYRKSGIAAPQELVEGIEDLQILYGVDTAGADLVPSTYVDASAVADFNDVVAIRVQLTVNSIDDVGASTADGILRRNVTQTIRLRNRLIKE